jgi:hypothetical protein
MVNEVPDFLPQSTIKSLEPQPLLLRVVGGVDADTLIPMGAQQTVGMSVGA